MDRKKNGNNDRVIISKGKYNMNFIDYNNEWERVAEVENMIDQGIEIEDKEEEKRIKAHREKDALKYGVGINNFPIVKPDTTKECYICIKYFTTKSIVRKLPCNHMFCSDCIAPWIKTHFTCPTCKCKLKLDPDEEDEKDADMNNYDY